MRKQLYTLGKIFAKYLSDISDKELWSKLYKEFLKLTSKWTTQFKNGQNTLTMSYTDTRRYTYGK